MRAVTAGRARLSALAANWTFADLVGLTLIGAAIRLVPFAASNFPLHDGGMFFAIINDIRAHGMALPDHISYNGGGIPFDYPPLAFWVAAALPFDPMTSLRVIPAVATILVVPVFYMLARELLDGHRLAVIATLIFAMTPRSWEWLVAGGGLTRATGMLAALVAIWQLVRVYKAGRARNIVAAGVSGGLAALLHPEAAIFLAVAWLLLALTFIRNRRTLGNTSVVFGIAFLVVLPWLVYLQLAGRLFQLFGVGALGLSPADTVLGLIKLNFTDEQAFPIAVVLAIMGVAIMVNRRQFLIPAWLAIEILLAARGATTYATVPVAMAAAIGLQDGVVTGLFDRRVDTPGYGRAVRIATVLTVAWLALNMPLLYGLGRAPFDSLTPASRAAMNWAVTGTPADARFVVVSGQYWWDDAYGEWLPVLSQRVSVSTMQGYEWFGTSAWNARLEKFDALQECSKTGAGCVNDWLSRNTAGSDLYVLVPKLGGSVGVANSVATSSQFDVVYQNADVLIARWTGTGGS